MALFERLLHKNRGQHCRGCYFQRCLELGGVSACAMIACRLVGLVHIATQLELSLPSQVERHLQLLRMLHLLAIVKPLTDGAKRGFSGVRRRTTGTICGLGFALWCYTFAPALLICLALTSLPGARCFALQRVRCIIVCHCFALLGKARLAQRWRNGGCGMWHKAYTATAAANAAGDVGAITAQGILLPS